MTNPLPMFTANAALAVSKKKVKPKPKKNLYQFDIKFKIKLKKKDVFFKKNIGKIEKEETTINVIAFNKKTAKELINKNYIKKIKTKYNYVRASANKPKLINIVYETKSSKKINSIYFN
jgi:hypothetical protein